MDKIIKQYRWYDTQWDRWEEWKVADTERVEFIRYCISNGNKYQIRTLTVTDVEGWGIDEQ